MKPSDTKDIRQNSAISGAKRVVRLTLQRTFEEQKRDLERMKALRITPTSQRSSAVFSHKQHILRIPEKTRMVLPDSSESSREALQQPNSEESTDILGMTTDDAYIEPSRRHRIPIVDDEPDHIIATERSYGVANDIPEETSLHREGFLEEIASSSYDAWGLEGHNFLPSREEVLAEMEEIEQTDRHREILTRLRRLLGSDADTSVVVKALADTDYASPLLSDAMHNEWQLSAEKYAQK